MVEFSKIKTRCVKYRSEENDSETYNEGYNWIQGRAGWWVVGVHSMMGTNKRRPQSTHKSSNMSLGSTSDLKHVEAFKDEDLDEFGNWRDINTGAGRR